MKGKVQFSNALVGLAVFGGTFIAALAWFSDGTTGIGIGVVAMNLVGASAGLKVPVFIVAVLMAIMVGAFTVYNSRDKLLRQKLQSSEEQYALSIAATQDGMWFWDFRTDEQSYSPRWMEILGYTPSDIKEGRAVSTIHPDDHDRAGRHAVRIR